ncbi:MAG: thioredoxin domain-containing protein, partial [Phycisphaerae bacterium]
RAADFILAELRREGRLLRTWRDGKSRLTAYLDDYAFLVHGLLNLYEATFDGRWLDQAVALTDTAVQFYYDETDGAFFFTASDAEKLVARSKDPNDGAVPAGNSVQALNLLRLAILLDRKDYRAKAESVFRAFGQRAADSPGASETLLCAADFYHDTVREIAIIGPLSAPETAAMLRAVYDHYLPNKVVVHSADDVGESGLPLLRWKKRINGQPAAYVCERYNCKLPVTTADALVKQLKSK